ncbi:MAG TPA: hypothetical protein VD735_07315, partial [Candidatus Saccharimonadales bacterium]|nr:hypothetical protein [Candidatus Saccharimonadales bacterium]
SIETAFTPRRLVRAGLFGVALTLTACHAPGAAEPLAPVTSAASPSTAPAITTEQPNPEKLDCTKFSLGHRASAIGQTASGANIILINSQCTGNANAPTGAYDRPSQEGTPLAVLPQNTQAELVCFWPDGDSVSTNQGNRSTAWLAIKPLEGQPVLSPGGGGYESNGDTLMAVPHAHTLFADTSGVEGCNGSSIANNEFAASNVTGVTPVTIHNA